MKLIFAKLWLKKYIKYNYEKFDGKTFNRKLNWAIVNLSHRVCKLHSQKGHDIRQEMRKTLWAYGKVEIRNYQPTFIGRILRHIRKLWRSLF